MTCEAVVACGSGTSQRSNPLPIASDGDQSLFDLLDRVLDQGLVVSGDLTLTVAEVPLLYVALDVTLCAPDRIPADLRAWKGRRHD